MTSGRYCGKDCYVSGENEECVAICDGSTPHSSDEHGVTHYIIFLFMTYILFFCLYGICIHILGI
jgi:hypothetical protein